MSRRGDNIHKRKDGRWEGRYKCGYKTNGTVKYNSVYAGTYLECKQKLENAISKKNESNINKNNTIFSELISSWLSSNSIRLKGATKYKYSNIIENHLLPELGNIKVSQLNSAVINSFLDRKINSGGLKSNAPLSPSYVKTMAIIIEAVINYGVCEGLCEKFKTPINKPVVSLSSVNAIPNETNNTLIDFLAHDYSKEALGTLLALQAGLRIGEVCALQWNDIDFKGNMININHTVARVKTNTDSNKTVLILDEPTVDNLEYDAVYTLVCTLKDMSGNEYSKIALSDGKEYETVKFSINRDGSTFAVNEATAKLLKQYYIYSINEDVVIEEINVDPIENYTVKLNNADLVEGKDYTTVITGNNGEWSKRTYIVKKSLFEKEGEYNIIVESVDKAQTTAFSDVKNLKIAFVVDQTAPVLTISGLEEGGRYQVGEQVVTVIPTDDGGKLNNFKAILLDSNGNEIEVRFEMSGDELIKYLEENDGKITFTIPEGFENQVRIICNDCAVNADEKTNAYDKTFTKITVSQNGWVIYYANKPLFFGSIIGVILLTAVIIFFIVYKKRKKKEDE